jgi:ribonucleoside-diphosphate reductase alpha chain
MRIFKSIRTHLDKANQELAIERGECPDAIGYGKRFSHTMAVAPNASSSILMGNTSPGIEPFRANAYRQDTLSGFSIYKNRWLHELLLTKNLTDDELNDVWKSIIADDGSVQKLTILTDDEKMIFKTALEIDQRWVIELATDRAQYIDQGQSVNVFFRPDAHIKYLHAVHFTAWKKGLKGLYYLRSDKVRKADKVSQQIQRNIIEEIDMHHVADGDECLACQ